MTIRRAIAPLGLLLLQACIKPPPPPPPPPHATTPPTTPGESDAVPDWHGGQERHAAIVDLIQPPRGGGPVGWAPPLPAFTPPSWPFSSQLPESVAFPPDNHNYYSPPVAGTIQYQEPTGQTASIIDAYGWLWPESPACTGDPDWHFAFEIDPARTNIDLNVLYKVGNAIHMGRNAGGADKPNQTYRVLSTTPRVHVEVTGWRLKDHHNVDPAAWGWVHSTPECEDGGVRWAFDPGQPEGQPIAPGSYVRITGLLVTDGFHICDSWGSGQLPRAPYQKGKYCDSGDLQDVKKMWANCHNAFDDCRNHEFLADNLARWYEIHSPDAIHLETEQRPQTEVVREIILSADHGVFSGMTERIDDDIWPCPADPSHACALPRGKSVGVIESIDGLTNYRTITDGKCDANGCVSKVDLYPDHVHVMVQVHGQGMDGAPGKFKATYRVFPCDCGCDGTCAVPGSTARTACLPAASCSTGQRCVGSACVGCPPATPYCAATGQCAACCPTCDGTTCGGSDGCGGTCRCRGRMVCQAGACVSAPPPPPRCPPGTRDCGDGRCISNKAECP